MAARSFAIIGLGTFGARLASELQRFGNDVIGIDLDEGIVAEHSETVGSALIADARSEAALREAGVAEVDVGVIAAASDLELSVMAAINLKMLGVPQVWAKGTSRTHHRILSKLGVDRVIHPEEEVAGRIAQILHNPQVHDWMGLGNGLSVVSFEAAEALEGRSLAELRLARRFDLRCLGVMRGTEFIGSDDAPCALMAGDRLLLMGRRGGLRDFAESL